MSFKSDKQRKAVFRILKGGKKAVDVGRVTRKVIKHVDPRGKNPLYSEKMEAFIGALIGRLEARARKKDKIMRSWKRVKKK